MRTNIDTIKVILETEYDGVDVLSTKEEALYTNFDDYCITIPKELYDKYLKLNKELDELIEYIKGL